MVISFWSLRSLLPATQTLVTLEKKEKKRKKVEEKGKARGCVRGVEGGRGHSLASLGGVDEGNSGVEHRLELEQVKVD